MGALVWTCDLDAEKLDETRDLCGSGCETRVVDVRDREAVRSLVAAASENSGRVDILVNNAGGVAGQIGRPLEEVTEDEWRVIFDINLTGAFNFSQAVVPSMKVAGWGRIVNISSGAGLRASLTGIQAYASAKAGLIGLTRQLAHELGPSGITVNCVAPGFIRCNPTTERQWDAYGKEGQERLVGSIATRRLGRPEDIAHAVLFFASDQASWITGQTLSVDGGR
jgi:3-oxoacyl-[acyl-carrier protein] reductase